MGVIAGSPGFRKGRPDFPLGRAGAELDSVRCGAVNSIIGLITGTIADRILSRAEPEYTQGLSRDLSRLLSNVRLPKLERA